ncbi:MAG: thermonuclease family protein [Nitrospira sp.]|nr:thermonuclease family protein [Nitrospira sp.]
MIVRRFLVLLLSILVFTPAVEAAFPFTGKVVAVLDGDTIEVLHHGKAERIRLNGVDCPEKKQAFGQKAKQFTSSLVFGKSVMVVPRDTDRYKRIVGDVFLPDGVNLSYELVRAGLAWWYRKYSDDVLLAVLELEAQLARRGLWADPQPVPPWEWRKIGK